MSTPLEVNVSPERAPYHQPPYQAMRTSHTILTSNGVNKNPRPFDRGSRKHPNVFRQIRHRGKELAPQASPRSIKNTSWKAEPNGMNKPDIGSHVIAHKTTVVQSREFMSCVPGRVKTPVRSGGTFFPSEFQYISSRFPRQTSPPASPVSPPYREGGEG